MVFIKIIIINFNVKEHFHFRKCYQQLSQEVKMLLNIIGFVLSEGNNSNTNASQSFLFLILIEGFCANRIKIWFGLAQLPFIQRVDRAKK